MFAGRPLVLIAALAALVLPALALPAPAPAAGFAATDDLGPQPVRVTGAMQAQSTETDILAVAQFDRHFAQVLNYRPGLAVAAKYDPRRTIWVVTAREAGSTSDLARMHVDDRTRAVRKRDFVPFDQYPPRLTRASVVKRVRANRAARREIAERGGFVKLRPDARFVDGTRWEVRYKRRGMRDALVLVEVDDRTGEVDGVYTGHAIPWEMARGNRFAFAGDINKWYIWAPLLVLFGAVLLDLGRLRSWYTADVVALLSLAASHELFNRGLIEWSIPLAVPPLAWLCVRMAWLFWRGVTPARGPAGRWQIPTWALIMLALFALGVRYGIAGYGGGTVVDVGYAGVAGASQVIEGRTPYGNMPDDNQSGDTYGPLNYLVYVPAVEAFGGPREQDWGEGLPAAVAVAIASDVLCLLALVLIGWRWISRRAAALLAAGWALCPWTAYAVASGVNDLLVAALLLFAFAALPRPWLKGGLVARAAAVKFVPILVLAPALHAGARGRVRQALWSAVAVAVVAAASVAWLAHYPDGWDRFVRATWEFQYDRDSPFSIWGLYDWRLAQQVAQAVLLLAILASCVRPHARDFRQVAAGIGAVLLGTQLVLQHLVDLYIPWFLGFVLIVLVAAREHPVPRLEQAARRARRPPGTPSGERVGNPST